MICLNIADGIFNQQLGVHQFFAHDYREGICHLKYLFFRHLLLPKYFIEVTDFYIARQTAILLVILNKLFYQLRIFIAKQMPESFSTHIIRLKNYAVEVPENSPVFMNYRIAHRTLRQR